MIERSDIVLADAVITDPADVRQALRTRVAEMLAHPPAAGAYGVRVIRLVVPVEPMDPFRWLAEQSLLPRVYWSGRDDGLEIAAAGEADLLEGHAGDGYDTLRAQLDRVLAFSDDQVRYFGGFRFDPAASSEPAWEAFGTYRFVLPRFELDRRDGEMVLVCNLLLPRDQMRRDEILAQVDALALPTGTLEGTLPLPVDRHDVPDAAGWRRNVEAALEAFAGEEMEKVVLARRAEFAFSEPVDALVLLKKLREATPNCFHFAFQPIEEETFIGATPERLFQRDGRRVRSEAVAGTRLGAAAQGDAEAMRDELVHSEKDLREHGYVRDSIRDGLEALCEALCVEPTSAMRLARGWHLVSRLRGSLHDGVHGSEVMRVLHPTPAVGGYPTPEALEAIRALESFDRGWYAGPLGWIARHGAEFAVAIRSGLVRPGSLSLFSGAGIVAGSVPEDEWNEIEQKIGDFVRVLGLEPQAGG